MVNDHSTSLMNKAFRFLLVASAAVFAACDPGPTELRLAAPSAPLDLEIAQDLAALLDNGPEFRLNLTSEQYSGEAALDMLLAGKADIALVSNFLPYREGVSTVMPLYPTVLHIAYRNGRDTADGYALLNQASIYAGAEGSASRRMFERIAHRIGLPANAYTFVEQFEDAASVTPDIAVVFAPISPVRMAELDDYQLFSFGSPSDIGAGSIVDAAALLNPPLRPFVIPTRTYGALNNGPVVTIAVDKVLVVRNDLDASVVYDLINEIHRSRPALASAHPGLFEQLNDSFDVSKSTFVLHAGTQDFLQRAEPTIYERYSGVAEVFVTLAIALASAALAGLRILKMRRKNRIDEFYSAVINIRKSISASSTADEKQLAAEKIRELQNTAFDQLVDEKLSADESFRIFITLSNDVLDQLSTV